VNAELLSLRADVESLTVELLDHYEEITLLYASGGGDVSRIGADDKTPMNSGISKPKTVRAA
jgi:hypothetical protein